ncbi:MAG TPA: malto-oligosyltrehalose trehalohydrolase [Acidimicrobiales bacterium]
MELWVWAPRAERSVEVVVGERRVPLRRGECGRWSGDVPGLGPGDDYAFSVDGGPPRPDPRSAHQPHGVHGPSRVVDHAAFPWSPEEAGWRGFHLPGAVLYELHVGTFSPEGTFEGAIGRLDHLVDLGVDAVELLPVGEFPGRRGWGYDGVDLWAPHHAYGGPDGLKALVDACHRRGLGVVLDVVYNHVGPAGNYLATFGPYFSDRHRTNWGEGLNVDGPGSDEVRAFVVENALMWLRDYHVDGLRLDAVHAIVDDSARHLLEQLADEVRHLATHLRRPLWLIAESDRNDPRYVRPSLGEGGTGGGFGLHAAWADEWHHALHAVLTGERSGYYADFGSFELLAKGLRQAWVYDGTWSAHRERTHGRSPLGLPGEAFVVAAQNHDQVGNRAAGDRLGALVPPDRLYVAAALLLTSPFVPMLFQGEEWGASTPFLYFTDHDDPELGRAVSEGRRREFADFGWDPASVPDPQDPATFRRSVLCWEEVAEPGHAALLRWHRALIALRRARPELAPVPVGSPSVGVDHREAAGWLVVRRGALHVAVNLGSEPQVVPVPQGEVLLASVDGVTAGPGGVALPPDSVAIVAPR